jgi:hypothetical protein
LKIPLRSRSGSLEASGGKKPLHARTAAEGEPHRTRRLEAKLETEEWTAAALEKDPVQSVLNDLSVLVETRGIPVRGLANLSKTSRDTRGKVPSPGPLLGAQRPEIAGEDRLAIAHRALSVIVGYHDRSARYLFAADSSIVRSLRARA